MPKWFTVQGIFLKKYLETVLVEYYVYVNLNTGFLYVKQLDLFSSDHFPDHF